MNKTKIYIPTELDILSDMLIYYTGSSKRRAITLGGGCFYLTDDGRMCVAGRHLKNPSKHKDILSYISSSRMNYPTCMHESVRHINMFFFRIMQTLHDKSDYWNAKSLTVLGKVKLNEIIEDYNILN